MRASWCCVLLVALSASHSARAESTDNWTFAGYNKTMLMRSRTIDAPHKPYELLVNRTRLKLGYVVPERLELHLEDDLQFDAGSYLQTAQSRAEDDAPARRLWNLRSTVSQGDRHRLHHDVHRGYAKLSLGDTDLWVGRQRISLGTGRLWSTVDLLNPLNPLQLERVEYVGVDALRIEHRLGELDRVSAIYAPLPQGGPPRWSARYATHIGDADVSLTAAQVWSDALVSADIATQVGGLGLHAELTGVRPPSGHNHVSAVFGADYAFANTLTFALEAYVSSQPEAERAQQFNQDPLRREIQPLGTRYAGLVTSYEFTPLLKGSLMWLNNLRDHSRFVSASLAYSVSDDVVAQVGLQRFHGREDSEYGRGQGLAHAQLQWFF